MKKLLHLLMILAGNLLLAFCVSHFVVPAGLISGGATGLSLAAHHLLPGVPLEVWIWGLTIFFFALGAILLGREFALSTLVSTVAYPLFFSLFSRLAAARGPLTQDIVLNTVFAGLIFGVGVGLILRTGASSGGSDVIAMVLNKRYGLSVSHIIYLTEAIILLAQTPFSSIDQILYGLVFVLIYSIVLEKVLLFGQDKIQIMVYSSAWEEINRMILTGMDKGCTLFPAKGGFTGEETWVVQTVIPKRSLFAMREKILAIDPKAFVVINPISEVRGRGFTMNKDAR